METKKRVEKLALEKKRYEDFIEQNPKGKLGIFLETDQDVMEEVRHIIQKQIFVVLETNIFCGAYIFQTGRDPSMDGVEAFLFCGRVKPSISWGNGKNITKKDMIEIGFEVETLYESVLKYNSRVVEAQLQRMFHHLPLGRRLWQMVDRGAKNDQNFEEKKCTSLVLLIISN